MRRVVILAVSAVINASTVPSLAAECTSIKGIDASRSCWELLRSQPAKETDNGKICCAYATSFYGPVTLRQVEAGCGDGGRNLAGLDSEFIGFNDLLATKCDD